MDFSITERQLRNKSQTRTIPVIEFTNKKHQILGEFLMADGLMLEEQILEDMADVQAAHREVIKTSGNRCGLEIRPDETLVYDLFEDLPGVEFLPSVKLPTDKLQELVLMWRDVRASYRQ